MSTIECPVCKYDNPSQNHSCENCGSELPLPGVETTKRPRTSMNPRTATNASSPNSNNTNRGGRFGSSRFGNSAPKGPRTDNNSPPERLSDNLQGVAVVYEGSSVTTIALHNGKTTIGRDPDSDIVISNDTSISGQHGILFVNQDSHRYLDTSSNGSKVNETTVNCDRIDISHGDKIYLGNACIAVLLMPKGNKS